jgi:hypothetical protein
MALLGVRGESIHLTDSVGNIRACVCREVEEHTDQRSIIPLLLDRCTVWIRAKGHLRVCELVCTSLSETHNACNLLNEACLSEGECSGRIISSELDSEVLEQPFLLGEFESAVLEVG